MLGKLLNLSRPQGVVKDFIFLLLERGKRNKKRRGRNIDVKEKYLSVASPMPQTEDLA